MTFEPNKTHNTTYIISYQARTRNSAPRTLAQILVLAVFQHVATFQFPRISHLPLSESGSLSGQSGLLNITRDIPCNTLNITYSNRDWMNTTQTR